MANVDGALADKGLFLLKVPAYVADRWKEIIDEAERSESTSDAQPSPSGTGQLGWITLDEHQQQHLELSKQASDGERLPKRYKLMEQGQIMPQSHIISQERANFSALPPQREVTALDQTRAQSKEFIMQLKCEGRVTQLLTAQPNLDNGQFDKRYMQLTGARDRQANTASTEIKLNTERVRQPASLASTKLTTSVAKKRDKKRSLTREEFLEQKSDIEAELFTLFEKLPNWSLTRLMKETGLAPVYLKETLQGIAVLNKRGPYKDSWTIKKEFLENPHAMEEAAAADGAPRSAGQ